MKKLRYWIGVWIVKVGFKIRGDYSYQKLFKGKQKQYQKLKKIKNPSKKRQFIESVNLSKLRGDLLSKLIKKK